MLSVSNFIYLLLLDMLCGFTFLYASKNVLLTAGPHVYFTICYHWCRLFKVRKYVKHRLPTLLLQINTLRKGDADLRFYITTVQDG